MERPVVAQWRSKSDGPWSSFDVSDGRIHSCRIETNFTTTALASVFVVMGAYNELVEQTHQSRAMVKSIKFRISKYCHENFVGLRYPMVTRKRH